MFYAVIVALEKLCYNKSITESLTTESEVCVVENKIQKLLFGKTPGPGRQIYLDYLRVIATIFVIGVHTVSLASSMVNPESASFYALEIFDFLFLCCNLLFVMISGALLLPIENESVGTFLGKRFSKIAVPFVIYYILYVCAAGGMMWLTPKYWRVLCLRILDGAPMEAPHLWLVYVIMGLYILTPLLRYLVQNIPDEVLAGVLVVVFVVNALDTYLPVFGLDAHLSVVVDSFAGAFLLGYFLSRKCSKRTEDFLIIGGILSFLISCFLILNTEGYKNYIYDNAPTMLLFSATVFLLVKRFARERQRESLFTRLVCKYSFSVLLIHWGVLHFFVKQVLHVNVLSFGIIGGCILMIGLTLLFSICGAVVIDNTIVWLVHLIGHGISNCVKAVFHKRGTH